MTTITLPRAIVEQALETIEGLTRDRLFTAEWAGKHGATITALRAALAQQAEPVHDRHGACPTHCCPVHGCKYMHDDCPVVSGAVQPVYPRNNGCESCADDALAQQDDPTDPGHDVDVLREHVRHLERRVRELHAQQAEPAHEPAYKVKVTGRWHDTEPLAAAFNLPDGEHLLYTTPPQRTMVPLTEKEIEHIGMTHQSLRQVVRAVEKAVWEKNNGQA